MKSHAVPLCPTQDMAHLWWRWAHWSSLWTAGHLATMLVIRRWICRASIQVPLCFLSNDLKGKRGNAANFVTIYRTTVLCYYLLFLQPLPVHILYIKLYHRWRYRTNLHRVCYQSWSWASTEPLELTPQWKKSTVHHLVQVRRGVQCH